MYFFKSCSKSYLFNKWLVDICACYLIKSYIFIEKTSEMCANFFFHSIWLMFTWATSKIAEIFIWGKQIASEEWAFQIQVYSVMSQKWILTIRHTKNFLTAKISSKNPMKLILMDLRIIQLILEIECSAKYVFLSYPTNEQYFSLCLWYHDT